MSVKDCLIPVIGLSNNECECFATEDQPEDYNVSLSGYYVDDAEFSFPLQIPHSIQDCGNNDVWSVLARARDAGVTQFLTDFGANLLSGPFKTKMAPFNDWIGKGSHNMNITTADDWVGIKICPAIFKGTMGKVFKLELYVSGRSGETIEVSFFDEAGLYSGTALGTIDVDMEGNKGSVILDEAFLHDFMNEYSQREDLWILYQPGVGFPRNNTVKCATCGSRNSDAWMKYFSVAGVTADNLEDFVDLDTRSGYAYGIRINVGLSCGQSWLCQNWDWDNDVFARVMAECIMLYSIRKLAGIILNDPGPNLYTQISREEVAFHRDRADKLAGERMPWLADNVPEYATHCFECNTKVSVKELLV